MGKESEASHFHGNNQQSQPNADGLEQAISQKNSTESNNGIQSDKTAPDSEQLDTPQIQTPFNFETTQTQSTPDPQQNRKEENPEYQQPDAEQKTSADTNQEISPYSPEYQPPDYYSQQEYGSTASTQTESDTYKHDSTDSENSDTPSSNNDSGGEPPENSDTNSEEDEEGGGPVKPFLEHLEDLRWTLVKSVTAVLLGMLICLAAGHYLVAFLMWPLDMAERVFISSKSEVAVMIGTNVIARGNTENLGIQSVFGSNTPPALQIVPIQFGTNTILAMQPVTNKDIIPPQKMVVIKNYSPIEGIMVALKLALFGGLVVSFPFVMFFIGQFILPALHVHEKKILFKTVGFSGGLFLLGVLFCYFIVVVFALGATVQFSQWLGFGADEWRADAYLSFVVKFMLGMGLAFQMPVIILLLVKIGLLDYEKLKNFRTYAFVANLVISAVVTPSGDPFTMLAMALPLHALYEISTLIAWIWHRRELKKAQQENN
ncbi:MAG: twin-arginine translocase subunit TatC [Verrucomicrobiae bacterium]|nr:twin-arginine translocase subunit TatC [Verrucomicrobiae bacterium]